MTRPVIIALSVVCCGFGLLGLDGPHDLRSTAVLVNIVLAIACYVLAGRDLVARGWSLGWLFAGAYLLPLIGLVVYVGLSNRPLAAATVS